MRKKRIFLKVAYDGTNYHGWQIQPNAITIENQLNSCLSDLLGEEIKVIGASRTDTGVHALGNIAVFDTSARMPGEKISYALNQRLPEDIRIQESKEVELEFHPRYCNSKKTYEYRIYRGAFPLPTKRLYSHYVYHDLDIEKMKKGAIFLVGEHDFKSFCQVNAQVKTTIRTIYNLNIETVGDEIIIQVSGNGFLYNMVRIIVGTLIDMGKGRKRPEDMEKIINMKDRSYAGPTAPARGLTLMKYEFL